MTSGSRARCRVCGLSLVSSGVACPRCSGDPARTWVMDGSTAQEQTLARTGELRAARPLALEPDERYEVLDTLGRGGMGLVYRVRDRELDEVIALKVLRTEFDHSELAVEHFKQEIKLARRINHPNVARLYDLFLWRGLLAISQEYILGLDLVHVLEAGALGLERMLRFLRYLCSALGAAHDLGVVHRDLKPGNIRIDRDDRPRILDFGLAALAGSSREYAKGWILGTPAFMAPEQAHSPQDVDHRADIYSLGVVIFRMATGELPFVGREPSEILRAHTSQPPPRPRSVAPDLPLVMEDVILRCLQKDPTRRYAAARDVYEHASRALEPRETHHARGELPPVVLDGKSLGKVLVVDDDEVTRLMARSRFEALGLLVVEAADGQAGVEAALREAPTFILLDIKMPVLDGRDALRILKANPATASIPVVMLTGLDYSEEAGFAREAGASTFLNKPIQPDVLELLVEKYCR